MHMAGLGSSLRLASPSAGPSAARIDHLNRQIAGLVAQNKDALARITTLERSVQAERERGDHAMKQVEGKWKAERAEWLDSVDLIQGAHEIAHLRTLDELHATRVTVMLEQDRVLKERVRIARKEFNLAISQGREHDLERELALVTHDLEVAREDIEFDLVEARRGETQKLQAAAVKVTRLEVERKNDIEELAKASKERTKLEREIDKLKTINASLAAETETAKNRLERLTLKMDGAQNAQAELERKNNELKLSNKDLKQQLDKWQKLENKGGAEAEQLKKEIVSLQARLQDNETVIKDVEKKDKEHARLLQKEAKKVANLVVEREQLQDILQQTQQELESARRSMAKELKRRTRSPTVEVLDEEEVLVHKVTMPKKRRFSPTAEIGASDKEAHSDSPVEKSKKRRRADDRASDDDGRPPPKRKAGQSRTMKSSAVETDDDRTLKPKAKAKKSRASEEPERTTATRDKASIDNKASSGGKKSGSSKLTNESEPVKEPTKKRKIFFPTTQPFEFNMPQQDNALNIPTALSPIKQPTPASKGLFGSLWK